MRILEKVTYYGSRILNPKWIILVLFVVIAEKLNKRTNRSVR